MKCDENGIREGFQNRSSNVSSRSVRRPVKIKEPVTSPRLEVDITFISIEI
jgi:hypothetical protein